MSSGTRTEPCIREAIAGKTVMEIGAERGHHTQAAIRKAINEREGLKITHQKFSQWCRGDSSFPNDFAEIFSRTLGLTDDERIKLALALSFGQRNHRLLKPGVS